VELRGETGEGRRKRGEERRKKVEGGKRQE
jgi:hypothetical protein